MEYLLNILDRFSFDAAAGLNTMERLDMEIIIKLKPDLFNKTTEGIREHLNSKYKVIKVSEVNPDAKEFNLISNGYKLKLIKNV